MNKQLKGRANQPAGGFVAIGRDGAASSDASRAKGQALKREAHHQQNIQPSKKPRIEFTARPGFSSISTVGIRRYEHVDLKWKEFCSEVSVDFKMLFSILESSYEKQNTQKAARVICAVIRDFIERRKRQSLLIGEPLALSSILLFVKQHPNFLLQEEVVSALCSLLTSTTSALSPVHTYIPPLLHEILKSSDEWDWSLVNCFIDDSLHERFWVDQSSSNALVLNIQTAFGTEVPSDSMYSTCELTFPERYRSTLFVKNRYNKMVNKSKLDGLISSLTEICDRRGESVSRNVLKTMSICAGNSKIRLLAAKKMDSWLLNGKLQRYAMELSLWIARNLGNEENDDDMEALGALLKLRALKSKQINTLFNVALREILSRDGDVMCSIVKMLLSNEFSQNRFPYNMTMMHSLFVFDNASASKVLARELLQILAAKEEYVRVLRAFLREFVRSLLRTDFDFALFASHIFEAVVENFGSQTETTIPHFSFKSLIEICVMLPFLSITATVREAAQLKRNSSCNLSQYHIEALTKFYNDLRNFFEVSIGFLTSQHQLCSDNRLYVYSFYRILYLAATEYYFQIDNWPIEADVAQYIRIISEVPISEKLLCLMLKAAWDRSVPIDGADAIDLVETLTRRAFLCTPLNRNICMVSVNECNTIELLFNSTAYRPPSYFQIKDTYNHDAPTLAVKTLYWKAWLLCVLWVSLNKGKLIKEAYENYPNLKIILQMVLTWEYRFPPLASASGTMTLEDIIAEDENNLEMERQLIKKLETKLAGGEVAEDDSKLLGKLCRLDISGPCRRPPDNFFVELEKFNEDFDLSRLLSECREPDILADIIHSQGCTRALPSIVNLINSNPNAIVHLPIECVCELFLHYISNYSSDNSTNEKLSSLLCRLQNALRGPFATDISVSDTLECLLRRLSVYSTSDRSLAAHCLYLLLSDDANASIFPINRNASPASLLSTVACFSKLKSSICAMVSKLCPVESQPLRLTDYLKFLSENTDHNCFHKVAYYISCTSEKVIDDEALFEVRSSILSFYEKYMKSAQSLECLWPAELDSLPNGKKVTVFLTDSEKGTFEVQMSFSSVCGVLKLLCCRFNEKSCLEYKRLMDIWFPVDKERPKVSHGCDQEFPPPSLKLKMMCSVDERIVKIALENISTLNALKSIRIFGLSSSTASELLSILDRNVDEVFTFEIFNEYKKSAQFIRAYRLRGAIGGEQFEAKVLSEIAKQSFVKDEHKSCRIEITLDPLPIPAVNTIVVGKSSPLSVSEAFELVKESLKHDEASKDSRWPDVIYLCADNVEFARRLCSLFRNDIKLLSNEAVAATLFVTMGHLKKNNSVLREDLHWLHANIEDELEVPQSIKDILSAYSLGATKLTEKMNIPSCKALGILKSLSNDEGNISDQNRLIERYLTLMPQIIPLLSVDANGNYDTKCVEILQSLLLKPSASLKYLVSLIPSRCESSVISKVIRYLLQKHRSELCGSLVFQLFMKNLRLMQDLLDNSDSCDVFNEYLLDILEKDFSFIASINEFILVLNESVLSFVFKSIANAYKSKISSEKRQLIKLLVCKLNEEFPDVEIENEELVVKSLVRISVLDKEITNLITDLFSSAERESPSLKSIMDSLLQFAFVRPKIVIRHIPMLSSLLASLESVSSRLICTRYKDILSLLTKIVLHLLDKAKNIDELMPVLKSLLCTIEANGRNRQWSSINILFAKCCVRYAKGSNKSVKMFFAPNKSILKSLFKFVDSPSAVEVLEILESSACNSDEI